MLLFFILSISSALAQTVTLTFTAKDVGNHYVQLNRVAITNLTKSWQETIYWPDTTLTMQNGTGIEEHVTNGGFALSQNNPNPFYGTTDVSLTVANEGLVTLEISDVNGKILKTHNVHPQQGTHQFRVSLSTPGTYVMSARQKEKSSSIKMVCNGGGTSNSIDYLGMVHTITYVLKSSTTNPFNFGDMMEYVGYATINGTEMESQRITQAQGASQTFVLQFDVLQNHLPALITQVVNNITSSSATVGGIVTTDGGAAVFDRGVCYSTITTPTVSDNCVHIGQGTGSFSDNLTGLSPNTTYYVRAYAMNSVGTAYGNEVSFTTTTAIQLPTVITTAVNSVAQTIATCGGNVTSDGGATVTARGVCWSTSQNPTTADSHTSDGSGTGSFTSSLTGLTSSTTYYVRAYATNSAGTSYGNEVSFTTTASAQVPSATTAAVSNVTETSATCGGNVTSDGGATVTARGVCWSTSQNPTTADSHTSDGSGTGSFASNLTGLTANTTYYVRAYATNSAGTTYGNEVSFTTADDVMQDGQPCPDAPTVTDIDNNTYNTVQIGQQCWMKENLRTTHYSNGTSIILGSGISTTTACRYYPYYNQSIVPTYGYLYNWLAVMGGSSSSSANPSGVQGICPVGWHVPSDAEWTQLTDYVSNQSQYVCGSDSTYIAKALASITGWNSTSYTCAVGNNPNSNNATGFSALPAGIYNNGYDYVETYADFWCATAYNNDDAYVRDLNYYYADVYRDHISKSYGLSVRCVRNEGDSSTQLPIVTTTAASNITANSATCGGNITSDGGATVTARGVCWSTSQNPTTADSHTTDGSGTGIFTSSITGLTVGNTYHVRAYATNSAGTAYGNEVIFSLPCTGAATVTDIDNNIYNTVQIGQQCWMKENLRTTRYADGTSIALGSSTSTSTAYRYYPDNNSSNVATYGYLYNWKAVMGNSSSSSANPSGVQGICPTGWHVPSDAEWTQLTNYVSSQSQYVCVCANNYIAKALASTIGWNSSSSTCCTVGNDPSTNNETGFSALPAAGYSDPSESSGFGYFTYFWSTTDDGYWAYCRKIDYNNSGVSTSYPDKSFGFSVRCVRDLPTVTTTAVSSIQPASATCGGNVTSDGGATVTARGVCWSTSQNPTTADSHTIDGNGTGIFTSNITNLSPATQYYVRAYATNIWGTAYGNEVSFITNTQPCQGAATVNDIDNNTYNTVQIGNQCWMKENLRTTHYANGTSIPLGSTYSYTDPYRYYPNNDQSNVATYGYLYNWKAVMGNSSSSSSNPSGVQGICPIGWHVPSDAEWTQLEDYVGGPISQYQYVCGSDTTYIAKALASTTGWNTGDGYGTCAVGNNPSANNATGFSAFPAGRYTGDYYPMFSYGADFWSATLYEGVYDIAYIRRIQINNAYVFRTEDYLDDGFSVRCVRNEGGSSTAQLPTVTTSAASNITANSATCGGNVTTDGGATVTARGVCWSTSHNPTVSNSHTTDGSGTGSFTSSLTGLTASTTYYVRAYATNSVGTSYGNEVSFTTLSSGSTSQDGQPCPNMTTVTDIDGNVYNTVHIGNQCWLKENLRVTKFTDSTLVPIGTTTSQTTPYRYCPGNDSSNVSIYGYLYNWPAVMHDASSGNANPISVQGICPTGWHVPSSAEWTQLTDYVSSQSQYVCGSDNTYIAKSLASDFGWANNTGACAVGNTPSNNNATNFSAVPAGCYWGSFGYKGYESLFWTSSESSNDYAMLQRIRYNQAIPDSGNDTKLHGFSVRCILDEGSTPTPSQGATIILEAHNVWGDGTGYQLLLDADATAYGTIIPTSGPLTSSGDADATTYAAFEYKIPQNADGSTHTSNMVYDGAVTLSIPAGTYDYCITNPTPNDRIWIAASENGRKDNFIFQEGYSYHFSLSKNMDNTHDTVSITVFNSSLSTPSVTTTVASNVSYNSATCGGNVISNGGATVTVRGVCWSTSHNPTVSQSHTTNGGGTGGFTSSLTGLTAGTTYYVRAYATNSVGTAYGNEVSFTTLPNGGTLQDGQPCPGAATLTDIDGNVYNTVQIGNQCWMKENLKTTKYADGTSISHGSSTSSYDTPYWYYPNNNSSNKPTYGLLYNWKAMMNNASSSASNPSGVQGICPTGWHVPSYAEWTQLTDYVSSQSQWVCGNSNSYIAKALAGTTGWDSSTNTCAVGNTPSNNNATGFSALPAGNNIDYFGYCAYFWSTTQNDSSNAYNRYLYYSNAKISSYDYYKSTGYSVRCVRNEGGSSTAQLPTVTTSAASNITANSATCGGNITSDGGAIVTALGVCWSTSHNPTVSNSHTSDGSGIGGTGIFTSNLTGLTAGTTYYVRAYATNSAGTAYGSEKSFTTFDTPQDGQPCPGTATLTDYDGNVYNTVLIGNQCWMKENLRTTHYDDGTIISYWDYEDAFIPIPLTRRGYLYNWYIVMNNTSSSASNPSGVQGICPTGWHVPSYAEWTQLTAYVSSQSQYVCGSDINYIAKALASQTDWISFSDSCSSGDQSLDANNATGFSAVPAGMHRNNGYGYFDRAGRGAFFWTSTKLHNNKSYYFLLGNEVAYVIFNNTDNTDGLSVRCVKD